MNVEYIFSVIYSFLSSYPLFTMGICIVLALLLWKNPGVFMKLAIGVLLLAAALYVGSLLGNIGGSGLQNKYKMSTETESKITN